MPGGPRALITRSAAPPAPLPPCEVGPDTGHTRVRAWGCICGCGDADEVAVGGEWAGRGQLCVQGEACVWPGTCVCVRVSAMEEWVREGGVCTRVCVCACRGAHACARPWELAGVRVQWMEAREHGHTCAQAWRSVCGSVWEPWGSKGVGGHGDPCACASGGKRVRGRRRGQMCVQDGENTCVQACVGRRWKYVQSVPVHMCGSTHMCADTRVSMYMAVPVHAVCPCICESTRSTRDACVSMLQHRTCFTAHTGVLAHVTA